MFSRLLFPTDCSAKARLIVALISGLEPRPEQVCLVMAVPIRGMEQPLIETHLAKAKSDLEDLAAPLRELGIETPTRVLTDKPSEGILRTALEMRSDLLVIGSFGKSPLEEILKGSLSSELARTAAMPVLWIRFGILSGKSPEQCVEMGRRLFEHILHPTDMSECSTRALDSVLESLGGGVREVDLVHVIDDVYTPAMAQETELSAVEEGMRGICADLQSRGIAARCQTLEGDPVADIIRVAGELKASCIVLGSRGKSLVREAVVGSVSREVLRMANKPVLVVR